MPKPEKNLVKTALEYAYTFTEQHRDLFVFHDYRFINESAVLCKEIAKGEDLEKADYENGIVAVILSNIGAINATNATLRNDVLVSQFLTTSDISINEQEEIKGLVDFLNTNKTPLTPLQKVIRDAKDIHLGQPDALERLSLLQVQEEKLNGTRYSEMEWLNRCKAYFITHGFDTQYANREYGATRSKNYIELEKRIDRLRVELQKEKRSHDKNGGTSSLSSENEDLFKIAFRNYINLIGLADSKAGLLIQVNSILASVVVALTFRKLDITPLLIWPTLALLVGSALTIFYSILASKPLERKPKRAAIRIKEQFFFGSFDRLDPDFKEVSWDKYSADMTDFFGGDKRVVFDELIKESFEVRIVLSKKFNYLNIAYKIFFAGLVLAILGFITVMSLEIPVTQSTIQQSSPF